MDSKLKEIPANIDFSAIGRKTNRSRQAQIIFDAIRKILPGLAQALGPDYELVLHDFKDLGHSLIAIEGNVTGRVLGSPLTDLILQVIRKNKNPQDLLNYESRTSDGRTLRSSTLFVYDTNERLIGCLCVNRDLSNWIAAQKLLQEVCKTDSLENKVITEGDETFVQDVEELLMGTINEIIASEKKPVKFMDKTDKIRVLIKLDTRGIFLIRGAINAVARALNVSRYTIYNYLEEGRQ